MTRLSNRQYPMLRMFAEGGAQYFMRIDEAQAFDQRPFRSMLIQKWVAFRPGRGFHLTPDGRKAWHEFLETEIFRKDPQRPLTAYFDATAYGLDIPVRVKRKVSAEAGAA